MHNGGFATSFRSTHAQLWRVLKEFHTGEFVKALFDRHHLKRASIARSMGISPQAISGMFDRADIGEDLLARLSNASGIDFLTSVRRERARIGGVEETSMLMEPPASYGRSSAVDVVVHMDDYDEPTQLKILRFIQQLPKRGRKPGT